MAMPDRSQWRGIRPPEFPWLWQVLSFPLSPSWITSAGQTGTGYAYAYRYLSRRTAGKTVRPVPHLHKGASACRPITIDQLVPKLRRHTRYLLTQIKAGVDCATQMESAALYSSGNLSSRQLQSLILSQSDISLHIRFVQKPCAVTPRTPRCVQPYRCGVRCKAVPLYLAKENQ